jgi:formyltetrahydrofolate deformylase
MNSAILLLSCRDQKGIVAKISDFIYRHKGNIEHADQHIDGKTLFMRIQWALDNFTIDDKDIAAAFKPLERKFKMGATLHFTKDSPRVAIFVSRHSHCLYDLLLRYQEGQFKCTIPLIVSNHPDTGKIAEYFGIKFVHAESETDALRALKTENIEIIVLARYMQVLSAGFVKKYKNNIINIHHSFLPAFAGGNPYEQAYARGVKIIGATSHYVTEKLDDGPIIEQNTVRISHRDSLDDLKRKGKDLEKLVLSSALRWHLERKILVYSNKTVIFD